MPFWSASRITGTINPLGVSAAKPMWKYFFSTSASPSSEALNSGNFFSAATQALIRNASIVTLTPAFSYSLFSVTRKASSSVMSASSWFVTCGIITQLRCRFAPEIFLMRDRSLRSTAPNLAKSTTGHGSRPGSEPPVAAAAGAFAACALVCAAPAITDLTKPSRSACVMRPCGPLPLTSSSGTPSSRAVRRIVGEACGRFSGGAVGSCGGSAAVGTVRSDAAGAAADAVAGAGAGAGAGAAAAGAVAGAGAAPAAASMDAMIEPLETRSPTATFSALMTPACDDGISIDALSLSTVIRLCSAATVSPTLTSSSMTPTSAKSPMSGTAMSTRPPEAAGAAAAGAGAGAAAAGAGAGAAAAAGAGAGAAAAPVSSISSSVPSLILSPRATFSSLTTPACEDGISMDALSLSTVTRLCSARTVSPGLTSSSMIWTSLKSPMSGTFTSTKAMCSSPSGISC